MKIKEYSSIITSRRRGSSSPSLFLGEFKKSPFHLLEIISQTLTLGLIHAWMQDEDFSLLHHFKCKLKAISCSIISCIPPNSL
jgi:hypothetical protein